MEQSSKIEYSISSSGIKYPGRHFGNNIEEIQEPGHHPHKVLSKLDAFDNFKNDYSKASRSSEGANKQQ